MAITKSPAEVFGTGILDGEDKAEIGKQHKPASKIDEDANHRFATDAEKASWDAKADAHDHPYLRSNATAVNSNKWAGAAMHTSTEPPTGGSDGDIWFQYTEE